MVVHDPQREHTETTGGFPRPDQEVGAIFEYRVVAATGRQGDRTGKEQDPYDVETLKENEKGIANVHQGNY